MTRIAVVGGSYSAEVAAGCLASLGLDVVYLNASGKSLSPPCLAGREAGVAEAWKRHLGKNLHVVGKHGGSLSGCEFIFVYQRGLRPTALEELVAILDAEAGLLRPGDKPVLVFRSISAVGASDELARRLEDQISGTTGGVLVCPDFGRQGQAMSDFLRPARGVVIGHAERDTNVARALAGVFAPTGAPIAFCDRRTAEFVKIASDAFLSTKLSFINELSAICEAYGVDASEVARLLGIDPDIGPDFMEVGLGWGGTGLGGSVAHLQRIARSARIPSRMLTSVKTANNDIVRRAVDRLERSLAGKSTESLRIALLGLAFKPDAGTDQPSPALNLARELSRRGFSVAAYDPNREWQHRRLGRSVTLARTPIAAAQGADAVVVATAHEEFLSLDLARLRSSMRGDLLLDCRNCVSPIEARRAGMRYEALGKRGGEHLYPVVSPGEGEPAVEPKRIAVIGGGYVGLVAAGCLATFGHAVTCVDIDQRKVDAVLAGRLPVEEPGLDEIWRRHLGKNLRITSSFAEALPGSELVFLCVGTPQQKNGSADTSQILAGATSALDALTAGDRPVFVIKSTVPISTGDTIATLLRANRPDNVAAVISNPEFLRESRAVEDFMSPQQGVIVGSEPGDEKSARTVAALYSTLGVPIAFCGRRTAETVKYTSNAFLATKVSFMNELAELCDVARIDVTELSPLLGMDPRIRNAYLGAGLGWGGSCLPKDLAALRYMAGAKGLRVRVIPAVEAVNRRQLSLVAIKLAAELGEIQGRRIAILGLTFKPNSDDLRDSQSLFLADMLRSLGCRVIAFDPIAMEQVALQRPWIGFGDDAYETAAGADAVIIATAWPEFMELDFVRLRSVMRTPLMVDARNCMPLGAVKEAGLTYRSFGRARFDGPPLDAAPARVSAVESSAMPLVGGG